MIKTLLWLMILTLNVFSPLSSTWMKNPLRLWRKRLRWQFCCAIGVICVFMSLFNTFPIQCSLIRNRTPSPHTARSPNQTNRNRFSAKMTPTSSLNRKPFFKMRDSKYSKMTQHTDHRIKRKQNNNQNRTSVHRQNRTKKEKMDKFNYYGLFYFIINECKLSSLLS